MLRAQAFDLLSQLRNLSLQGLNLLRERLYVPTLELETLRLGLHALAEAKLTLLSKGSLTTGQPGFDPLALAISPDRFTRAPIGELVYRGYSTH